MDELITIIPIVLGALIIAYTLHIIVTGIAKFIAYTIQKLAFIVRLFVIAIIVELIVELIGRSVGQIIFAG